jgi:hypothetical protein
MNYSIFLLASSLERGEYLGRALFYLFLTGLGIFLLIKMKKGKK